MPKKLLNKEEMTVLPKGFKRVLEKKTFKIPALTVVMMLLALGFSLSDDDITAYAAQTNFAVTTYTTTIQAAAPTFSEYWYQDNSGGWHINDGNGNLVKNAWLCDDAVASNGKNIWYLIDANGDMVSAGLVQDQTGSIYSLETSHQGYYGMLRYQSGVYDGIYLDLEGNHDGAFANIKNQDGRSGLQAIYGLTQVNIDNSNIVYTSNFRNTGYVSSGSSSNKSTSSGNQSTGAVRDSNGNVIPQDYVDELRTMPGMTDELIRESYEQAGGKLGDASGIRWN